MAKKPTIDFGPGGCAAQDVVQTARATGLAQLNQAEIKGVQAEAIITRLTAASIHNMNRFGEAAVAKSIAEIVDKYIAGNKDGNTVSVDDVLVKYGFSLPPASENVTAPGRGAESSSKRDGNSHPHSSRHTRHQR